MPQNITGVGAGTVQSNNVNNPNVDHMRGRNLFPQSFMHPSTCRYGEVDLVGVIKAERGDIIPYKFVTDLNTFTMAAPLKSEVDMYSAAFKVPMQALYPRNWDIMMPFPNKGDDVPEDTRALLDPLLLGSNFTYGIINAYEDVDYLQYAIRNVFLQELVFSAGSLFTKCNYHFNGHRCEVLNIDDNPPFVTFDRYFDRYFAPYLNRLLRSSDVYLYHYDRETANYIVSDDKDLIGTSFGGDYYISTRRAYELLRTGEYLIHISAVVAESFINDFPVWNFSLTGELLNIEPLIAYKCACTHFFTNPKIDYVYSWELFRDAMQSLVFEQTSIPSFIWNGVNKLYDVFSCCILKEAMMDIDDPSVGDSYFRHTSFWFNLLSWSRSLRYGDYFTGVHPEPLAVGDINAPITDSSVNALEIVEKIQLTRLYNKVNISGPRKDDQLVAMYGGPLPEAPKDVPIRLSLEKFNITGFEVNNTGDLQAQSINDSSSNITTTNLRLTDSKFMFEVAINEPCWLVVVQYFEAHRIYSKTLDRFAFHRDRLDDFQPDLQYLGDQEVYTQELDAVNGHEVAFAYNLRNMEYKQRYSYASGGFIDYLPSWLFITDNNDGNPPQDHINPDYIRSSPSEFDRFYKSLMGWSLAGYFHFITTNTNVVAPYRQMVYAPEILA